MLKRYEKCAELFRDMPPLQQNVISQSHFLREKVALNYEIFMFTREESFLGFITGAAISLLVVATIEGGRWLLRRRRGETLPSDLEDRVSRILDRVSGRLARRGAADPADGSERD